MKYEDILQGQFFRINMKSCYDWISIYLKTDKGPVWLANKKKVMQAACKPVRIFHDCVVIDHLDALELLTEVSPPKEGTPQRVRVTLEELASNVRFKPQYKDTVYHKINDPAGYCYGLDKGYSLCIKDPDGELTALADDTIVEVIEEE